MCGHLARIGKAPKTRSPRRETGNAENEWSKKGRRPLECGGGSDEYFTPDFNTTPDQGKGIRK